MLQEELSLQKHAALQKKTFMYQQQTKYDKNLPKKNLINFLSECVELAENVSYTSKRQPLHSQWLSSFLTAHQHNIGPHGTYWKSIIYIRQDEEGLGK